MKLCYCVSSIVKIETYLRVFIIEFYILFCCIAHHSVPLNLVRQYPSMKIQRHGQAVENHLFFPHPNYLLIALLRINFQNGIVKNSWFS